MEITLTTQTYPWASIKRKILPPGGSILFPPFWPEFTGILAPDILARWQLSRIGRLPDEHDARLP